MNIKNWYQSGAQGEKPCPTRCSTSSAVSKGDSEEQMIDNTKDLWHQRSSYVRREPAQHIQGGIAIYSVGPNGKDEHDTPGADDIVSWR